MRNEYLLPLLVAVSFGALVFGVETLLQSLFQITGSLALTLSFFIVAALWMMVLFAGMIFYSKRK